MFLHSAALQNLSSDSTETVYHSGTADHNKDVIVKSISEAKGIVRVEFATVALGMGVNLAALNRIVHYGAPRSLDDYFQECGRAGRSGEQAFSIVFWCPPDAPKTYSPCTCSQTRHYYSVILFAHTFQMEIKYKIAQR